MNGALAEGKPAVIEVITERAQNHALHLDLIQQLSGLSTSEGATHATFYADQLIK